MSEATSFKGKWISTAYFADARPVDPYKYTSKKDPDNNTENEHILFRKNFYIDDVQKAEILISADDYYKLYINGFPVGQGPAPGYPFHYYFDRLDVTDYLMPGENTIAVHTYYQGLINRVWVSGDMRHGLLLDLIADGKTVLISDETFLYHRHTGYTASGKCGYDTQFLETYDSRSNEVEFEYPDFDDSDWEHAHICKYDDRVMFESPIKQLVTEPIKPILIKKTENGLLLDFGSCYVGYLYIVASGKKDSAVTIRCGQELNDDGTVRYKLRANCVYSEEWILSSGDDILDWFDYKSFRYAELILPKGATVETENIRLIARHYPFELTAKPSVTDPKLLNIWDMCVRSLRYGVQETVMDCMEREKGQYVGDGVYTSTALAVLTGDTSIMERLIDDAFRSDFINDGLVTCTTCSFLQEIAEYSLMLPWLLCVHYHLKKDKAFIQKRYDNLVRILDYYSQNYEKHEKGLLYDLDKWCVIDWPQGSRDGYACDPKQGEVTPGTHNVISAYFIGAVKCVNRLGKILGKGIYRDDTLLTENFNLAFYDRERHIYKDTKESDNVSLPGNILPLLFDLCPDEECEQNIQKLISEKGVTSTNIFMGFPMLAAVKRVGNGELLEKLLLDEGGWLRMLREGSTVTMEAWGKDLKWNTSLYHLAFTFAALYLTDWNIEELLNG